MRRGRGLGAGAAGRRSQPYIDERAAGAAHACPLSRGEMGPGGGGLGTGLARRSRGASLRLPTW